MLDKRTSAVRALLAVHGLDALLVTRPVNLRYLCNFSGSDGALLVTSDATFFLTDSRYTTQAALEVCADVREEYSVKSDGIVAALAAAGCRTIGFEAGFVTWAFAERLQQAGAAHGLIWQGVEAPLLSLRGIKDSTELALLEAAAGLAGDALAAIEAEIVPGRSEAAVSLALEMEMRRRGGKEVSFEIIVASGSRGALPHGAASEKLLAAGEMVTVDFGVRMPNGYVSDETVSFGLGWVSDEMRTVHETVYSAQQAALQTIRPGVPLVDIDRAARQLIADAGYGSFFGHGLGHGLGLEVHEYPTLSPRSNDIAAEGMVFTVEPGIYLPGVGGVRLEDTVAVTADGYRRLTRIPKELRILPV